MSSNPHDELKALVESAERNELECRKYLKYARGLLIEQTSYDFLHEASEYRGHSGDSDYIVVCRVKDGAGNEAVKAYLWEVKAPQCFLFEYDTMNRVRPTSDFISAENQLLHYYDESKGSAQFRQEHNIVHPDNVRLGGIIIGTTRTRVQKPKYDEQTLQTLFTRALSIRTKYFYGHEGIKILIWDTIVDYLKGKTAPPQQLGVLGAPISIPIPANTTMTTSGSLNL